MNFKLFHFSYLFLTVPPVAMAEVDDVVDGAVHDLKQIVHADQDCKPLEVKIKQFLN
jgi:hypothetical protein